MNNPDFLFAEWLLALPLAAWLVIVFSRRYRRQSMWSKYCEPRFLPLLITRSSAAGRNDLLIVFALLTLLIILALAGPSWQQRDYPLLESSASRVLILDLSRSMQVEDIKPDRLDLALQVSRRFLNSGFDGETALVVFAGSAFTVSPLTSDASTLLDFIEALNPDTMPLEGNRVDLALQKANQLLSTSITQSGQIIIVTDGISDFDRATMVTEQARQLGNQVSIVAIGSLQGGPMKSSEGGLARSTAGEYILARPNLRQLRVLSQTGNGHFLHLDNSSRAIDDIPGASILEQDFDLRNPGFESVSLPENSGFWLVWLALPLALLLFRRNMLWILLVALLAPVEQKLYAMDWNLLWMNDEQKAFAAYQQGDYATAEQLSDNPFLVGSALYRQQNYAQSSHFFSQQESAIYLYNQGNAKAHQGLLPEALEAYQKALDIDPDFNDALHNHDLIIRFLQQQNNGDDESSSGDDTTAETEDQQDEFNTGSRPGQANDTTNFREQIEQAGIGDSSRLSHTDLVEEENISETDTQLEQFLKQLESDNFALDSESVMLWVEGIDSDPSELFRRKFLRDHLRNKRQQR